MTPQYLLWGVTWGNNLAQLEWWALAGALGWLGRDRIGRKAAAWWDKHHGPHAVKRQKQAIAKHEAERHKTESEAK